MENETYMKRLKDRLQIENRIEAEYTVIHRGVWRIIPIELKEVP